MIDPQSSNPSNQFDTSPDSPQPSASAPSNPSPPATPEVIFTTDDMATAQFSEYSSSVQTFESAPIQSDE
jgi:hypothetical protein